MAYYSDELKAEVISQNNIVDVISEYVNLTKSGRNYIGLCPFHREKTPSFCVSMDKQLFKCFGCNVGGNVIHFIMKIENIDFLEALELLATKAHIDMERYKVFSSKVKEQNKDQKETIFQINKEAARYYHQNLIDALKEPTSLISQYIQRRKLDQNTITKFGIGYASSNIPLYEYLAQKGFSKEDIIASGTIALSSKGKYYDRFFSRLIFPIFDIRDRVIAFGGRVLDNSMPKYLNSQENSVYYKGKNLYAMNFVKREKVDSIIIVEGYMDAVSLQKFGFKNVVASLGTALTPDQARLIKNYTDNVIIAYDQDGAGQEATLRGLDILVEKGLNVKVLKLDKPDIKDPDEYVNKMGPERLKRCFDQAISLVEFKVEKLEKNLNLQDITSKIRFLTNVANILSKLENTIEREVYMDRISQKYQLSKAAIEQEVKKKVEHLSGEINIPVFDDLLRKSEKGISSTKKKEQYVIALMLCKDRQVFDHIKQNFKVEDFENENIGGIFDKLLKIADECDITKTDILSKFEDEQDIKELTDILYMDVSKEKESLLNEMIVKNNYQKYSKRKIQILERLKQNISKDEMDVLQYELNQIMLLLSKLK